MERFKLQFCLIGAESVGKTSFIQKLDANSFKEEYSPTIGVDFYCLIKKISDRTIKYQLWDTSGQDKFNSIIEPYCHAASAILAIYDISNKESFEILKRKLDLFKENIREHTALILIGNKKDLEEQRQVSSEEAENYAKEKEYLFAEISAKTGENFHETLNKITEETLSKIECKQCDYFSPRSVSLPKLVAENTFTLSTQRSQKIDAMSNSLLISSVNVYNRASESETKKFIADVFIN